MGVCVLLVEPASSPSITITSSKEVGYMCLRLFVDYYIRYTVLETSQTEVEYYLKVPLQLPPEIGANGF